MHRPPWHEFPAEQSESAVHPKKHALFTHQPPRPQSALKVQLDGTPASPEPEPEPPPVAPEPPPVAPEPPPEPPPVPLVPPSTDAGVDPPQNPAWQV